DLPLNRLRDEHRVLISVNDRMGNREQLRRLDSLGYKGDFSFEPFSSTIQVLPRSQLKEAINKSIEYLLG
ncbi:MAG: xylose isomerase, partial [Spirochaetota bacterium]